MKLIRNESLSLVNFAEEGDSGPWLAVDRYGRTLVVGALSVSDPEISTVIEGIVTAGSTSGQLVAANAAREFLALQNLSTTEKVHYSLGNTATTSRPWLNPGEYRELPKGYKGAVNIIRGGSVDAVIAYSEGDST